MNLDDTQKKTVAGWIAEGLNLAGIQKRLASELGVNLTYMDVRLLVDDLKLTPKDPERALAVDLGAKPPAAGGSSREESSIADDSTGPGSEPEPAGPQSGNISLSVDQLARPGTVVSGKVTFSDGKSAEWYLDQMGRLGIVPGEKGYKPSAVDLQMFQMRLQNELAKLGF